MGSSRARISRTCKSTKINDINNFSKKCFIKIAYLLVPKKIFQICLHTGPNIDPDVRDQVDVTPDKIRLREFIAEKFPNVESWPSIEESCIYTVCLIKS